MLVIGAKGESAAIVNKGSSARSSGVPVVPPVESPPPPAASANGPSTASKGVPVGPSVSPPPPPAASPSIPNASAKGSETAANGVVANASNTPFTGSVNGCAFDFQGSLYLTTSAGGIYFINQSFVNSLAPGTVVTSLVSTVTGLSDLATNFFPVQSSLPVTLTQFNASLNNNLATILWKVEAESDFSHYEVVWKNNC